MSSFALVARARTSDFMVKLMRFIQKIKQKYLNKNLNWYQWLLVAYGLAWLVPLLRQRKKSVKGKIVAITGGSGGLGAGLGRDMGNRGATVVLLDINAAGLAKTVEELTADGIKCFGYKVDLTDRSNIYLTMETIQKDVGDIDILVNNAGYVSGGFLTDTSDKQIDTTFGVNIISHFATVKCVLPHMMKRNQGHIVTIASAAGIAGGNRLVDYCASKFACVGFDESLRRELAFRRLDGIKTTCVCPYYINTGMFEGVKTRFPLLLPILEPEYVVKKIGEAIVYEHEFICLPHFVYYGRVLLGCFPTYLLDWFATTLGTSQAMATFKGHGKE